MTLKDEGFTDAKKGKRVNLGQERRRAKVQACESVRYTCAVTGGAVSWWEASGWW